MAKVMYFSILREKVGKREEEISFKGNVRELKSFIKNKYPEVSEIIESSRIAVNEEYVDESYIISDNDRIAFIPPVSGG